MTAPAKTGQPKLTLAHDGEAAARGVPDMEGIKQAIARAVESLATSGNEALFAESLRTQGLVLCKLGRQREAKRVLDRAHQVAERCGDNEGAGSALLIVIEEMCEKLDDDERHEIGARLNQLLADSQKTSTLERLGKCLKLIAAAHASEPTRERRHPA